ncbi:hypothetical protein ACX0G7_23635 [Flavitalea antarctica]
MVTIDLMKVPYIKLITGFFMATATVLSPLHFIFQYAPDVFKQYDTLKLVVACLALGIPSFIFSSVCITIMLCDVDQGTGVKFSANIIFAGMVSASFLQIMFIHVPMLDYLMVAKIYTLPQAIEKLRVSGKLYLILLPILAAGFFFGKLIYSIGKDFRAKMKVKRNNPPSAEIS